MCLFFCELRCQFLEFEDLNKRHAQKFANIFIFKIADCLVVDLEKPEAKQDWILYRTLFVSDGAADAVISITECYND